MVRLVNYKFNGMGHEVWGTHPLSRSRRRDRRCRLPCPVCTHSRDRGWRRDSRDLRNTRTAALTQFIFKYKAALSLSKYRKLVV
jgi:hypothetical protein